MFMHVPLSPSAEHDPFSYEIVEEVALVPRELLVIEASDIDGNSDGSSLVYTLSGGSVSQLHISL